MIRDKQQGQKHEVRGYTLLRNVRGKGSASAHWQGVSPPCTHSQRRARCTAFCR
jgi:hypothetical protein